MDRQEYLYDVIKSFVVSEKSENVQKKNNTYVFKVLSSAKKPDIKQAVETIFDVKVSSVNTLNVAGKVKRTRHGLGRTKAWKKAYVTLAPGETISFNNVEAAAETSAE